MVTMVIASLEVLLDAKSIVASIAIPRMSTVLAQLLPAALGLALGAAKGATISKTLLATSRSAQHNRTPYTAHRTPHTAHRTPHPAPRTHR